MPVDSLYGDISSGLLGSVAQGTEEPVGETLPEGIVHAVKDVQEARADEQFGVGEIDPESVSGLVPTRSQRCLEPHKRRTSSQRPDHHP